MIVRNGNDFAKTLHAFDFEGHTRYLVERISGRHPARSVAIEDLPPHGDLATEEQWAARGAQLLRAKRAFDRWDREVWEHSWPVNLVPDCGDKVSHASPDRFYSRTIAGDEWRRATGHLIRPLSDHRWGRITDDSLDSLNAAVGNRERCYLFVPLALVHRTERDSGLLCALSSADPDAVGYGVRIVWAHDAYYIAANGDVYCRETGRDLSRPDGQPIRPETFAKLKARDPGDFIVDFTEEPP